MIEPEADPVMAAPVKQAPQAAPVAPQAPIARTVADWARTKRTPAWLVRAAAIGARWEHDPQLEAVSLSESDYDAAISYAADPHLSQLAKG